MQEAQEGAGLGTEQAADESSEVSSDGSGRVGVIYIVSGSNIHSKVEVIGTVE